ncbi:MAG: hypothetical protein RMJ43_14840 [Chloroherpetonaceae bacterium]|nr:hypothetical protein [Chthonomonadaceae bacterium]MDW8209110.1 hypothetical protein [Chloroherpetonaceae bacterium]
MPDRWHLRSCCRWAGARVAVAGLFFPYYGGYRARWRPLRSGSGRYREERFRVVAVLVDGCEACVFCAGTGGTATWWQVMRGCVRVLLAVVVL